MKMQATKRAMLQVVIACFFLGLLPYLYVFASAAMQPRINWMGEPTIQNFIRLLLRSDYAFATNLISIEQRLQIVTVYYDSLVTNFSYLGIIIAILGCMYTLLQKRVYGFALLTGYILSGPLFIYVIATEINDADKFGIIEQFFMHSFVLFAFFLPFGFYVVQKAALRVVQRPIYTVLFLLPFFVIPIQMLVYNNPKTDLSQTNIGNNLGYDILSSLPKNSIVFLSADSPTFNTWYVHYVLGYRPDVTLVSLAGERNDYIPQDIVKDDEKLRRLLPDLLKKRPVYSMYTMKLPTPDLRWMPMGLSYQLVKTNNVPDKQTYLSSVQRVIRSLRVPYRNRLTLAEQNSITPNISRTYAQSILNIGDFLYVHYGDLRRAMSYYNYALLIDPDNSAVYAKTAIVQAQLPGRCEDAVNNIEEAIRMYKVYKPYYPFALRIYRQCGVDERKGEILKKNYQVLFGEEL